MKIIICGSMTASKEMIEAEKELTRRGHEVVLPHFTREYAEMKKQEETHRESVKNKMEHDLIRDYYKTIKDGDSILWVNVEKNGIPGYIGGNSFLEMGFAHVLDKPIYLLHAIPNVGYRDEVEAMKPHVLEGDWDKI